MALFRRALTLRTSSRPEQVAEALSRRVKPGSMMQLDLGGGADVQPFRGEVKANSFRIVRRVQFRNSFAPILEGQVAEAAGGAEVKVSLFVPQGVILFVIMWTLLAAGAAMMMMQQMLLTHDLQKVMVFAVATIPLVGLCIAWLGFSLEAANSERELKKLLL